MLGIGALGQYALAQFPQNQSIGGQPSDNIGSAIVAHTFTRKRWKELQDALAAEHELELQAQAASGKRKEALEETALAAQRAIAAVENEQTAAHSAELVKLTHMMDAAKSAGSIARTLTLSANAISFAQHMADQEDEEDAVALLMLH